MPKGWRVDIIVIDDGSPLPAAIETDGFDLPDPFSLRIIKQENGGVATARNRGLQEMSAATTLVAFLDSDDIWPPTHLTEAIDAWNSGFDFSFSDNFRVPHHQSYCAECAPKTKALIDRGVNHNGLIDIPVTAMQGLIIEEFPTQASTVVFHKDLCDNLLFNMELKAAGEDMLFFVTLAARAKKICYNSLSKVECGGGINIFFGNFDWDSPAYLRIKQDRVRCHTMIDNANLPQQARVMNKKVLQQLRCDFTFHTIRHLLKQREIPAPASFMAKSDPAFWAWSFSSLMRIIVGYPLGYYRP